MVTKNKKLTYPHTYPQMLITFVLNKFDKSFPLYKNNIFYSLLTYHIKKERISSIAMWKIFKKMWIIFPKGKYA